MINVLSFIIPMYNEEENILNCLNQFLLYPPLLDISEIILINDGSTDNTEDFVYYFMELNPTINIKYFSFEKNKGVGEARNYGIHKSKGEYIYCIDADDLIISNIIFEILQEMIEYNDQIIFFDSFEKTNNTLMNNTYSTINNFNTPINLHNSPKEEYINLFYGFAPWRYIIKKNFLNKHNISFGETKCGEDIIFTSQIYYNIDKIGFIKKKGYIHTINPVSITHNMNNEKVIEYCNVWEKVFKNWVYSNILYYEFIYEGLPFLYKGDDETIKKYVTPLFDFIPLNLKNTFFKLNSPNLIKKIL